MDNNDCLNVIVFLIKSDLSNELDKSEIFIIWLDQNYVEEKLIPTWNWMVSIMDSTEAQLRYGSALSSAGDPGHPSHPLHASQHSARRERMTAREEASLRTLEGRR